MQKKTVFFVFFSEFFRFLIENFSDFRPKKFKNLWKLTSACPEEQLVALKFFKIFEPFWISYRKFWHGSQNSIYVSRVKIALETVFLFFFSDFFRILSEKFFRHLSEKRQDFVKTTFYVSRGTICGLIFFKFWIVSDFLQKPLAWFSKFHLRVQIKKLRKKQFFSFSFQNFFNFWAKIFQTFGQIFKKLWKLPSACPEEQFVAWNNFWKFWFVLDFLQKPLAWFSNIYLRVQSKNCGRNSFLIFLFRIFSAFEQNFFQTFGENSSKSCQD